MSTTWWNVNRHVPSLESESSQHVQWNDNGAVGQLNSQDIIEYVDKEGVPVNSKGP